MYFVIQSIDVVSFIEDSTFLVKAINKICICFNLYKVYSSTLLSYINKLSVITYLVKRDVLKRLAVISEYFNEAKIGVKIDSKKSSFNKLLV